MLGYCTNVHSGASFNEVLSNIENFYKLICNQKGYNSGIGLWLSNQATLEADTLQLKETLLECNVEVSTMNGFPYSDFHSEVVQHSVYKPNWCDQERLAYTKRLATIFSQITSRKDVGISTLPLGWNRDSFCNEDAADSLQTCIDFLANLEDKTGICVHLDIETEPGCRLQLASELANFVNTNFGDDERTRRYLRVCHDTCHGAVMHEDIEEILLLYKNTGLQIGKVQLSNAIEVDFTSGDTSNKTRALSSMIEPRYLHQTTIHRNNNIEFYENLSEELLLNPTGLWRIHFHVPIHLQHFGELKTTQQDLIRAIPLLREAGATNWEVETYTWDVVPLDLRSGKRIDSITKELEWATSNISR